jgi:hypothetical protein
MKGTCTIQAYIGSTSTWERSGADTVRKKSLAWYKYLVLFLRRKANGISMLLLVNNLYLAWLLLDPNLNPEYHPILIGIYDLNHSSANDWDPSRRCLPLQTCISSILILEVEDIVNIRFKFRWSWKDQGFSAKRRPIAGGTYGSYPSRFLGFHPYKYTPSIPKCLSSLTF